MSFQDKRLHRLSLYTKTNALVGSQGICLLGGRFRLVCSDLSQAGVDGDNLFTMKNTTS